MNAKAGNRRKFLRIITIPIRALCKARNIYVKSITSYSDRMNYGGYMVVPGACQVPSLPRSFSVQSAHSYESEDFRELVRASSARVIGSRPHVHHMYINQPTKMKADRQGGPRAVAPRRSSVAMGRIDEEHAYYLAEKNEAK